MMEASGYTFYKLTIVSTLIVDKIFGNNGILGNWYDSLCINIGYDDWVVFPVLGACFGHE